MEWRDRAACKGKPTNWWFDDKDREHYAQAKEICKTCPVQYHCHEEAERLRDRGILYGLWGSRLWKGREDNIVRTERPSGKGAGSGRPLPASVVEHGTYKGHRWHYRRGEEDCAACRLAYLQYRTNHRAQAKQKKMAS